MKTRTETSEAAGGRGHPSTFDIESPLPYLYDAGTSIGNAFKADLKRFGITLPMWRVLAALADREDETVTAIAERAGLEIYTASRLVASAVNAGRVQRRPGKDARSLSLRLTRDGRALVDKISPLALALERTALAGIEAAEAAKLRILLRRIAGNVALPRRTSLSS